jgi:hypothetical protein
MNLFCRAKSATAIFSATAVFSATTAFNYATAIFDL